MSRRSFDHVPDHLSFGLRDVESRFTSGGYGVLHAAEHFETALAETIHHHALHGTHG